MKIPVLVFISIFSVFWVYRSIDIIEESDASQPDRKLNGADIIGTQVIEGVKNISIAKIREEIIDLHKNIKVCIDEEFSKEKKDILPFKDIMRLCAGDNYSIVLRFYKNLNFQIKELVKGKIKKKLSRGYCNKNAMECMEYFRMLETFINKDFELLRSIELTRSELKQKIDEDKLNYLIRITEQEINDYNLIRKDLLNERRFLSEYFTQQYNIYKDKFTKHTKK